MSSHLREDDPVTGRRRPFVVMADKVTELNRTMDAVDLMVMSEKGELHVVFVDYLFVTRHTGEALMRQIYEEAFIKKNVIESEGGHAAMHGGNVRWTIFQSQLPRTSCSADIASRQGRTANISRSSKHTGVDVVHLGSNAQA